MRSLENKNLYDILGVAKNATYEEIKKAYREKAKISHEDKGGNNSEMIQVNRAWAVLKDPIKRKHYDETGEESSHNFDQKFSALVQKLFFAAIAESQSIEHEDLIKKFKQKIQTELDNQEKALNEVGEGIKKLQKIMDRVSVKNGENHIGKVLENNMFEFKRHQKGLEIDVTFFKDALEVADRYQYDFIDEPQNTKPGAYYWGGTM